MPGAAPNGIARKTPRRSALGHEVGANDAEAGSDRPARGDRQTLFAVAGRQDPLFDSLASLGAAGMRTFWRTLLAAALLAWAPPAAPAAEPITIGLSMELTGPLAVVGRTGLLAMQIWAEDVNAKGGLLALTSSAQICIARRPVLPTTASGPVSSMLRPIVIGSAAGAAGGAQARSAAASSVRQKVLIPAAPRLARLSNSGSWRPATANRVWRSPRAGLSEPASASFAPTS